MKCFVRFALFIIGALLCVFQAGATIVQQLSFEELTDHSEIIVTGQIARSWAEWDSSHHFIWTHYELSISSVQKGAVTKAVIFSEPGGIVGGIGQSIAGTVQYQPGEKVVVFLERMPNGYLRTTGWAQGKYSLDASGRVHSNASLTGLEVVQTNASRPTRPVALDGVTTTELNARVMERVRSQQRTAK